MNQSPKSSTQHDRRSNIRKNFANTIISYTAPPFVFLLVRWILSVVIGDWNLWFFVWRRSDSFVATTGTSSAIPTIAACICALSTALFGPVADYLAIDLTTSPWAADPLFLILSVMEIHFFAVTIFAMIYALPNYIFFPGAIMTYPITHAAMHRKFLTVGASSAHLGYFAVASSIFISWLTLNRIKQSSDENERRRVQGERFMDGKYSSTS